MPFASYAGHINERRDKNKDEDNSKLSHNKMGYGIPDLTTKINDSKYLDEMFHKEWGIPNGKQFSNTNKHKEVVILNKLIKYKKRKGSKRLLHALSALSEMREGQVCKGTVKNITKYGAFINLGFIDAFIPRQNMSRWEDNHPYEAISIGDKIEVTILSIDYEFDKISLEMKQKCNYNPYRKKKVK